ncbi:SAM-dependent methyltransferase [Acrocarpospora phusangensis]|uniref:SAM-dependent methyltransferase n=1 Tax=Acrocarpospora phusangensis TaxID=1070424 RepID=A0A919QAR6_9ACTN|nr:N-6 DNA methylase [Acrocarpospora phusangensis]GIH25709.1 SAM-dependent methyltransferase [Acrocarpospora phusangensis]
MTYVNAGDIARLADVGRAAVSNWRRRHDDFPQPVGGTAASPLFSLAEVESWLRRNGKPYEVSQADLTWQRLRAAGDDLHLGELVAAAGDFLEGRPSGLRAGVTELLADLAAERGPLDAFEFLCERYVEAHSRQLAVTPADLAELMSRLSGGGALLDPACGIGTLLLGAKAALGQELSGSSARIAQIRLRMRGVAGHVVAGDSLRHDGFPGERADAVVCDPPFNERAWGHEELAGDPRWEYGLPPRGEPELAWVQHCLARVRPGGTVVILMPPAAASRRTGRRIRANLLRGGALRAVIALGGADLWLLRRPEAGERPPAQVLMFNGDLATVWPAWLEFQRDPRGVPVIDLLDDEVDVSPLRFDRRGTPAEFLAEQEGFRQAASSLTGPDLGVLEQPRDLNMTTVGELAKAGLLAVHHSAMKPDEVADRGEVPVLSGEDVLLGGVPSGWAGSADGQIVIESGDVVTTPAGVVRVIAESGAVLGPQLTLYRLDPARLDSDFLAGFLRAGGGLSRGTSRLDARRTRVPRLPLAEQRPYGAAFRRLAELDDALRAATRRGERLIRLGLDGLASGHLL